MARPSPVMNAARTVVLAASVAMEAAGAWCLHSSSATGTPGSVHFWGGRKGGLGGNLEPGRLGRSGGPGFPPVIFNHPSPAAFSLTEQSCSVPDLALLLFEGARSGTRRRRGANALAQAGGGTETETRRTAPVRTDAAL